jgi:mannose-6-phosphate isomerase-like protein (cupin superfamily)
MTPIFLTASEHNKGWGKEIWIVNNDKYCGKILEFNSMKKFSMHYHYNKDETWYVLSGQFVFRYIDGNNANIISKTLSVGDVIRILPGCCHQLECINNEGGKILEISTQHFDEDSYRVIPGDSQSNLAPDN